MDTTRSGSKLTKRPCGKMRPKSVSSDYSSPRIAGLLSVHLIGSFIGSFDLRLMLSPLGRFLSDRTIAFNE